MKFLKIFVLLILMSSVVKSQQLPLYSQFLTNSFVYNPAITGSDNFSSIRLTSRMQWIGVKDAPKTTTISIHSRIGRTNFYNNTGRVRNTTTFNRKGDIVKTKKMSFKGQEAIGAMIFSDKNGPFTRSGILLTGAYHFEFKRFRNRKNQATKLAVGLGVTLFQFRLNEEEFKPFTIDDQSLTYGIESSLIPDLNLGFYFYNTDYFIGYSINNLMESKIKLGGIHFGDNEIISHNFISAGYKYNVKRGLDIQSSILIKTTKYSPAQIDFNVNTFVKKLQFGFSYRNNGDIVSIFAIKYGLYFLGYSYEFSTKSMTSYSSGSHEIVIGYNLDESLFRGK